MFNISNCYSDFWVIIFLSVDVILVFQIISDDRYTAQLKFDNVTNRNKVNRQRSGLLFECTKIQMYTNTHRTCTLAHTIYNISALPEDVISNNSSTIFIIPSVYWTIHKYRYRRLRYNSFSNSKNSCI